MSDRLSNKQLMDLVRPVWEKVGMLSHWRHKNTGGCYEVQGVGLASSGLEPTVIYINTDGGGPAFIRPASEFLDGRFERIKKEQD